MNEWMDDCVGFLLSRILVYKEYCFKIIKIYFIKEKIKVILKKKIKNGWGFKLPFPFSFCIRKQ